MTHPTRLSDVRHLVFIGILALAVRALHLWLLRDSLYFAVLMGDARAYDEWASRLAAGDWLGSDVFYQAPLYPYLLGVSYAAFGRDLMLVRGVQAVLGALSAVLLTSAAARLFGRRAGLAAGLLMALYAPAVFVAGLIQKAALDVFLMTAIVWVVARIAADRERRTEWLMLGGTLGLLSLTRENALVLIGVALLFLTRRTAAPFLLGVTIVLAPVVARNQIVGGGWYLTTSQFGPNFYIGNNPHADGTYQPLREGRGDAAYERQDATELAEARAGRRLDPADVSAYWRNEALRYISTQPIDWLRLMTRKVQLLASATEMPDTEAQESHAEGSVVLRVLQPVAHFGIMLPLAGLGLVVSWAERRRLVLLYALAAGYASSVLIFFVVARYRYPLVPFVLLFAAAGLAGLPAFVRQASSKRLAATAAALGVVAVVAYMPVLAADAMHAITVTNLGVALQAQGRLDEAAAQYRRAIAIRPDYAPAYNNLGVVLQTRGQIAEALAAYQQALRHHPRDAGIHGNLGDALLLQGRHDEAIAHYRQRVELEPDDLARRYDLGNVLLQTRRLAEAEREFRHLTRLAPDAAQAHHRLGVALAAQEKFDEAIVAFRQAITLRPDFAEAQRYLQMAEEAREFRN
jgi:tetratricopeptide (TPR) repeat protein